MVKIIILILLIALLVKTYIDTFKMVMRGECKYFLFIFLNFSMITLLIFAVIEFYESFIKI